MRGEQGVNGHRLRLAPHTKTLGGEKLFASEQSGHEAEAAALGRGGGKGSLIP